MMCVGRSSFDRPTLSMDIGTDADPRHCAWCGQDTRWTGRTYNLARTEVMCDECTEEMSWGSYRAWRAGDVASSLVVPDDADQ